jgi:hypothetical protein
MESLDKALQPEARCSNFPGVVSPQLIDIPEPGPRQYRDGVRCCLEHRSYRLHVRSRAAWRAYLGNSPIIEIVRRIDDDSPDFPKQRAAPSVASLASVLFEPCPYLVLRYSAASFRRRYCADSRPSYLLDGSGIYT